MKFWSIPPRAKILQAMSLISQKKVEWVSPNIAYVCGKAVQIKGDGIYVNGNKNNYLDEKALAALMTKGKLPFSERIGEKLCDFDCFPDCQLSELEKRVKQYLESYKIYEKEVDGFIELVNKDIREKRFRRLTMSKNQVSILGYTE